MKLNSFYTFLITLYTLIAFNSFGQDSTRSYRRQPYETPLKDKIYFGGNIGLQFGTVTFAEVSPLVGYKITDHLSAGVGVTYQYYRYRDKYYDFETNVYGGRIFSRYLFTDYLFGHVEYEYLNLEAFDIKRRRVDVGSFMGGAGYVQPMGPNAALVAMILYNFTPTIYTPYSNPIIRIGINIGI